MVLMYGISDYVYDYYLKPMMGSMDLSTQLGAPVDITKGIYQAFMIELTNSLMGSGFNVSGLIHELLLIGGTDIVYNSV